MKQPTPPGLENSLDGRMSPDIHLSFRIFAAHWRKVNPTWSYPEHTHDLFELNVVLSGSQRMTVGASPVVQQPGDLLFIPPDVRHSSQGSLDRADMTYFCMHFDVDDLYLRRRLLTMRKYAHETGSPLETALRGPLASIIAAVREPESDLQRDRLAAQNACLHIFAALGEWVLQDDAADVREKTGEASDSAVRLAARIERLLQQSVQRSMRDAKAAGSGIGGSGERVSIERIAAEVGYSPAYCNRVFQRIYGVSPRQHLTGLILREAKLLLADSERSIEEIAAMLGYRDVSQFSKQFKRWTGMSPLGYRRLSH
jgi:AraC-like DNA-binding protein